eukprot:g8187.t1
MSTPEWKGLFEWSMKYSDGTRVSDFSNMEIDHEKMEWLQEVLSNYVKDFVNRMKEIQVAFQEKENQEISLKEQEVLLDELQEIVESLDQARNLHMIGGLPMLMELLKSAHFSLKSKSAEIIASCVQNNLPIQNLFLQDGVLPLIMEVGQDENPECQAKGWLAVSSLVRNCPEAQRSFMDADGFTALTTILQSNNPRLKKRGLLLMEYLLSHGESLKIHELYNCGVLDSIVSELRSNDLDLRERSLSLFVTIMKTKEGPGCLKQVSSLETQISQLKMELDALEGEERECREHEMNLIEEFRNLKENPINREKTKEPNPVLLLK